MNILPVSILRNTTKTDVDLSFVSHQNNLQKERTPLSMLSKTRNKEDFFSPDGLKHSQDFNSFTSLSSEISELHESLTSKSSHSRKVHFSRSSDNGDVRVEIFPIMSLKNHREKSRIWYNQRDFSSMQDENNVVVQLLEMGYCDETFVQNANACLRGTSKDSLVMTGRGLERHTKAGFSQYLNARSLALNAVLKKQKLEKKSLPCVRAEKIAAVYKLETATTLNESIQRAKLDAIGAREYLLVGDCDITAVIRHHALEKATLKSSSVGNRSIFRRQKDHSMSI